MKYDKTRGTQGKADNWNLKLDIKNSRSIPDNHDIKNKW